MSAFAGLRMLDLSRLQSGQLEPRTDWCSVSDLLEAALASVGAPAGGFEVSIDHDLPLIEADAGQLERALANVLENAIRYAGDEPVAVRATRTGKQLVIRVSDRGPGIPREEVELIFEPFRGVPDRESGSGLGLAIARGFVEANGGTLRASSLPGQGATFILQMPLDERPEPSRSVSRDSGSDREPAERATPERRGQVPQPSRTPSPDE